jgi:hypothetical protein
LFILLIISENHDLEQRWPTSFLSVEPKGQETPPGAIFANYYYLQQYLLGCDKLLKYMLRQILLKCVQITVELHIILNLPLQELVQYVTQFLPGKFTIYSRVLKSVACVALVCNPANEIRPTICFTIFWSKK